MVPQTPSVTTIANATAQSLLRLRGPFVELPEFSILAVQNERDYDGTLVPFSEWLTKRLQTGLPFVVTDFDKLESWPRFNPRNDGQVPGFGIERLIELSTKKNIPIRNCSTGRDLSFTLRKFTDSARQAQPEFQNLYARDLQCPQEWLQLCRRLLPAEVQWGGRVDLFQWLPPAARSEVMMAYVGSEGSSSGFHRCFSSTVALNFLVELDDRRPVVCIGTDFSSQEKYDAFMSARSFSPHLDWVNLAAEELIQADFPLYVYDQKVGDLVIFPPATAHQIWNPSALTTKLVWNILHPLSLEVGFNYVQPHFNRLCHPDVARTTLSLANAMLSLIQESNTDCATLIPLPPDLPLLSRLFRQMVYDESIDSGAATPITLLTLQPNVIATCNFCSTGIWNRHVRCPECADFDLCLLCYLNGRSCEHFQSYTWAELVSSEQCTRVLHRAREILGFHTEEPRIPEQRKTLGTAVNDLMRSKQSSTTRLCHLCRIDHPEWKGRRCHKCTAFFCYRGLFRHFDTYPVDALRHLNTWVCPKCQEICNCRCCHFPTAYTKRVKPASKRRVKPNDSRGKTMGFADNVFDQKRGRKESGVHGNSSHDDMMPNLVQITGKKRPVGNTPDSGPATPLRKLEMPTPEPEYSGDSRIRPVLSRAESTYTVDSSSSMPISSMPGLLPSMRVFTDTAGLSLSPRDDRGYTSSPRIGPPLMGSAVRSLLPESMPIGMSNTLAPILGHSPTTYQSIHGGSSSMNISSKLGQMSGSPSASRDVARMSPPDVKNPGILLDHSIDDLESQIATLRRYEEEFIALGLEDSRQKLSEQVAHLEAQIKARKREKSVLLIERLKREGFGGLAEVVGKEVGI